MAAVIVVDIQIDFGTKGGSRGYMPVVLEDCTAEPIGNKLARSNHEASLFVIQTSFGVISNSKEFTKAVDIIAK